MNIRSAGRAIGYALAAKALLSEPAVVGLLARECLSFVVASLLVTKLPIRTVLLLFAQTAFLGVAASVTRHANSGGTRLFIATRRCVLAVGQLARNNHAPTNHAIAGLVTIHRGFAGVHAGRFETGKRLVGDARKLFAHHTVAALADVCAVRVRQYPRTFAEDAPEEHWTFTVPGACSSTR